MSTSSSAAKAKAARAAQPIDVLRQLTHSVNPSRSECTPVPQLPKRGIDLHLVQMRRQRYWPFVLVMLKQCSLQPLH